MKSAKTWKSAAVESRKWRLGYVWLFHSWEQIPKDLSEIIKAAGPHYTIYNNSKKTFKDLLEEIAPYTVEDGLKLKRHHAINVLWAGMKFKSHLSVKCHHHQVPLNKKRRLIKNLRFFQHCYIRCHYYKKPQLLMIRFTVTDLTAKKTTDLMNRTFGNSLFEVSFV